MPLKSVANLPTKLPKNAFKTAPNTASKTVCLISWKTSRKLPLKLPKNFPKTANANANETCCETEKLQWQHQWQHCPWLGYFVLFNPFFHMSLKLAKPSPAIAVWPDWTKFCHWGYFLISQFSPKQAVSFNGLFESFISILIWMFWAFKLSSFVFLATFPETRLNFIWFSGHTAPPSPMYMPHKILNKLDRLRRVFNRLCKRSFQQKVISPVAALSKTSGAYMINFFYSHFDYFIALS